MKKKIDTQGFKVPEGYFSSSKSKTLDSIRRMASAEVKETYEQPRPNRRLMSPIIRYASIAACLGLAWIFTTQHRDTTTSINHDDELVYVDYLMENAESLTLDDLESFDSFIIDQHIDEDDLIDYLDELDLEDILELI